MLLCSLLSLSSFAQQRTVTGKVLNSTDNTPVAGATVSVKGTNVATQTGADGSFTLSAPTSASTLVISFVGFESQEVGIGNGTDVAVSLRSNTASLNEVVVTGYTAQRKKDIVGSVSVVNVEDMKSAPAANLAAQLQGRAPGVVVSTQGQPGAGAVVRVRGFSSFENNPPTYIVDGVPTQDVAFLNPNDVESMQVLKDAAAASIYGVRAANGIIVITTKQGRAGRTSVSYENYVGFQKVTDKMMPDMLNNQQYIDYLNRIGKTGDKHVVFGNYGSYAVPDRIVVSNTFKGGLPASDPRAAANLYSLAPGSVYQIYNTDAGTNW
ncbi:MAG TPA: TonB-dependent receptor plug domain-containing protein, partial [Chitinophagaceae bacterium]|nr:TonB-dependent receptor plug domain-containing protein [Chitinophagaceae bacterium]